MQYKSITLLSFCIIMLSACSGYTNVYHANSYETHCTHTPLKLAKDMSLQATKAPVVQNDGVVDLTQYVDPRYKD